MWWGGGNFSENEVGMGDPPPPLKADGNLTLITKVSYHPVFVMAVLPVFYILGVHRWTPLLCIQINHSPI